MISAHFKRITITNNPGWKWWLLSLLYGLAQVKPFDKQQRIIRKFIEDLVWQTQTNQSFQSLLLYSVCFSLRLGELLLLFHVMVPQVLYEMAGVVIGNTSAIYFWDWIAAILACLALANATRPEITPKNSTCQRQYSATAVLEQWRGRSDFWGKKNCTFGT